MNEIKILGVVCFVVFICWLFIEKLTDRSNRKLQQKHGDTDGNSPLRAETVKTCEPENNLNHATSEESDAPPASDDPDSPYYITKQQHRLNIMRAESIIEKEVQRRISEQKKAGTYVKAKTKKELQNEENFKEFREYFENKHREKRRKERSSFLIGMPLYLLILAVGSWVIYVAERDFGGIWCDRSCGYLICNLGIAAQKCEAEKVKPRSPIATYGQQCSTFLELQRSKV